MSENKDLSVIILTYNEEKHIERCIKSLLPIANSIFIVDSYSTDNTLKIAEKLGAVIFQNTWVNYSVQFQWGIDNCPIQTTWVMRMDADEYLENSLIEEIRKKTDTLSKNITGIYLNRREYFMGKWIKYGGFYPMTLLRIWRSGVGRIEQRWMDEHIVLSQGETITFENDIIEENLNDINWWIEKHNKYATREMLDLLNIKYDFFENDDTLIQNKDPQARAKRKMKENVYSKMPIGWRAFLYFIYRYILRFGFMDGWRGFVFHFLQGFWYRLLVDAKLYEMENRFDDREDLLNYLKKNFTL